MPLSFGVTVLPDPPPDRLVELFQLAESHGFEYGWTYDSRSLAGVVSAAHPGRAGDEHDEVRPLRDEPGHARSDGARERLRDAPRHLGRAHGDGHRPRRPRRVATSARSPSRSRSSSGAAG